MLAVAQMGWENGGKQLRQSLAPLFGNRLHHKADSNPSVWGQPRPFMSFAKLVNVRLSAGRCLSFPFLVLISAIKPSDYFGF